MAIHIDILAHLNQRKLMMEGEQLKKYVDSLESDINRRLEQGAVGRNSKIIASNNRVLNSYDRTINAAESATQARNRETAATDALTKAESDYADVLDLTTDKLSRARSPKSIEKWTKMREKSAQKVIDAEEELAASTRARVRTEQDAARSTRDLTAAQRAGVEVKQKQRQADADAAVELEKLTSIQDRASVALQSYTVGLDVNSTALSRQRKAHASVIDSTKRIRSGFETATDSVKSYQLQQKKLTDMMSDPKVNSSALETQLNRTSEAYLAMERNVRTARESVSEIQKLTSVQQQANVALGSYTDLAKRDLKQVLAANKGAIESNRGLRRVFDSASESVIRYNQQHDKLIDMMKSGTASSSALQAQVNSTGGAYRNLERNVRDATSALRAHLSEEAKTASQSPFGQRGRRMPDPAGALARNLGALTPLGTVTPGLLLPLGAGFVAIAQGAIAASQSLLLLPAALTAAGAGFGVVQMATMGVSDAFTSMMDFNNPEKFAESLRLLSPAAQQFVLSIQQLIPTFMELKNVVQDTFFAGMPQLINGLAQTYRDSFGNMAVGVSAAFNGIFMKIGDVLQDPAAQQSVAVMFDGIVKTFQALIPLVGSLTQVFVQLSSTGAQVLPTVIGDISSIMAKFSDFIAKAAASGDLAKWMTEGWEALKAFGSVVVYAGKMLFEVFGLHGPEDIQRFKQTLFGLIDGFGVVLGTFEKFFNGLVVMIRSIAQSKVGEFIGDLIEKIGGLENVLAVLAGSLLFMKIGKSIYGWGKLILDVGKYLLGLLPGFAAVNTAAAASGIADMGDFLNTGKGGKGGIKGAVSAMSDLASKLAVFGTLSTAVFLTWDQIIGKIREAETPSSPQSQIPEVGAPGRDVYLNGGLTGALAMPKAMGGMGPNPGEAGFDQNWLRNVPADKRDAAIRQAQAAGVPFNPVAPGTPIAPGMPGAPGDTVWGTGQVAAPNGLGGLGQAWGDIPGIPPGGFTVPTPNPGGGSKPDISYDRYSLQSIPLGQFDGAKQAMPDPRSLMSQLTPNQLSQKGYGYQVDPLSVFDAESRVLQQRAAVEEARARVLELAQDNQATEQEKLKAQNNIIERERSFLNSQVDLLEAQRGTWKKINETIGDQTKLLEGLGAEIDADFGISRGLPGIAENITKFLANIVAAPMYGALAGVRGAGGDLGGGKGLVGAAALSGTFGPQFMQPAPSTPVAAPAVPGAMIPGATTPGAPLAAEAGFTSTPGGLNPNNVDTAGLRPQSMALLSHIQSLPQFKDIALTSAVKNRENDPYPWHPDGRGLDFGVNAYAGPAQSALGDQLNKYLNDNKEMFGINHTLWKTMQGGDHFNHLHVGMNQGKSPLMQNQALNGVMPPSAGSALAGAPGGLPTSASLGGGSIPIPLPVTIVGGMPGSAGLPGITPPPGTAGSALSPGSAPGGAGASLPSGAPAMRSTEQAARDAAVSNWGAMSPTARANAVARGEFKPDGTPIIASGTPAAGGLPPNLSSPGQGMPMPWTLPPLTPPGGGGAVAPPLSPGGYAPPGTDPLALAGAAGLGGPPLAPGGYAPPGVGPTQIGAVVGPPEGTGSGFGGFSGGLLGAASSAIGAAAGAAGTMGGGPGGGAAASALAQMGIEQLNRAIAFAGQAAGIGVSGLMETFMPTGGSELANNSWFTKILGGVVGMRPLLPNFANVSGAASGVQEGQQAGNPQGAAAAGNVNVTQNNYAQNGNSATNDLERLANRTAAAPMPAMGAGR